MRGGFTILHSSPVTKTGWHSPHTARAYAEIMKRLGYTRYGVHGSDIGADILGELLKIDGEHIIGAHMATDTSTIIYTWATIYFFIGASLR